MGWKVSRNRVAFWNRQDMCGLKVDDGGSVSVTLGIVLNKSHSAMSAELKFQGSE